MRKTKGKRCASSQARREAHHTLVDACKATPRDPTDAAFLHFAHIGCDSSGGTAVPCDPNFQPQTVTHSSGGWSGGPFATTCRFSARLQTLETSCWNCAAGWGARLWPVDVDAPSPDDDDEDEVELESEEAAWRTEELFGPQGVALGRLLLLLTGKRARGPNSRVLWLRGVVEAVRHLRCLGLLARPRRADW